MDYLPKYHINLNIPVPFTEFEQQHSSFVEKQLSVTNINREFTDWLYGLDIIVYKCIFFSSTPFRKYRLHVDGFFKENQSDVSEKWSCVKINMVFNSTDTKMNWYKSLPGHEGGFTEKNSQGMMVRYWDPKHCEVLHTADVNSHCLFNGAVIHDLVNGPNNGQNRNCYTLWLKDKSHKNLPWSEAATRLQSYYA